MVLKYYSTPFIRGGSAIVALTLAELKLPFEHIILDMHAMEHKKSEYVAMHPFGQAPLIDDDGFIVYESRAICRYLIEKYPNQGPHLLPKGLKERTLVEQAAAVEYATFQPALAAVLSEALGKPARGQPVDQGVLDQALKELSTKLDVYEVILGKHKFLAGNDNSDPAPFEQEFTFADLCHYAYAPMLASAGIEIMTRKGPNFTRWWNELMTRPTWVKLKADGYKGKS
ncbi:Glutathione S-transferase [Mycena sanguinolenta]|uniref:glutathione transferase n=1 Tax=Mycena sanguinolenta TaxID=230812 RepID=A0A8H7CSU3_9AGAR|nr:Glutathione S-transferase [Mycena sanguinolenta]